MKKKITRLTLIFISLAVVFGFIFSAITNLALFDIFFSLTPTVTSFHESNILVLGLDDLYGTRSDTIMVVHVNPEQKAASIVSIPRDTIVTIPGRGLDKVNAAYAYGGEELARKTIEDFLHINLPYYIAVNLKGIEQLIDDIGGITVNVEKRMYYVDYAGDLTIDLQPGRQVLNGRQALGYLRFRHTDNDFARIGRQQNFMKEVASQLINRDNLIKNPSLFFSLLGCVYTNLNSREILGLSLALRGAAELNQIKMTMVPGFDVMVDGIYYLRPNETELQKIVSQYLSYKALVSSCLGAGN